MSKEHSSITPFQLFFFVVKAELGVGILSLPAAVYGFAKQDGWISILLTGCFCILCILLYSLLFNRFENMNILDICRYLFGKWAMKLCAAAYAIYFILASFIISFGYMASMRRWILLSTPQWLVFLILMMFGLYFGKESLRNVASLCQFAFWFTFLLFFFSLGGFKHADWNYLLPIQEIKIIDIMKGVYGSILSFFGFESLLIIWPFVKGVNKKKIKAAIFSTLFVTFTFLYITILCTVYFSGNEIKTIVEPTLFLLKSLTLYGIIERLDLIFLSVWVIMSIASSIIYLHLANSAMGYLFEEKENKEKKNKKNINRIMFIIVFLLGGFLPQTKGIIDPLTKIFNFSAILFAIVIPLYLLVHSFLFKKKRLNERESHE